MKQNKMNTDVANQEIHGLLRGPGYLNRVRCGSLNDAEYEWETPTGEKRLMKYQRRAGETDNNDRYLFGIAFERFDVVKDFVFWAEDAEYFLIIPTERLRAIFANNRGIVKIVGPQWHVNITFNRGGNQHLHPVHCRSVDVSEFSHPCWHMDS